MILWAAAETQLKTRDISRKGAKHVLSPVEGAAKRCHFDRREKSLPDPSPPLEMTDLGPSLGVLVRAIPRFHALGPPENLRKSRIIRARGVSQGDEVSGKDVVKF
jgi:hypothetical protein